LERNVSNTVSQAQFPETNHRIDNQEQQKGQCNQIHVSIGLEICD
jgi:hypothetical protein